MAVFEQQSYPVFSPTDEAALRHRSAVRYVAWLRGEIRLLPKWMPLRFEYQQQLESLEGRLPLGPQALPSSDASSPPAEDPR